MHIHRDQFITAPKVSSRSSCQQYLDQHGKFRQQGFITIEAVYSSAVHFPQQALE